VSVFCAAVRVGEFLVRVVVGRWLGEGLSAQLFWELVEGFVVSCWW
jgi:hypothetical protein